MARHSPHLPDDLREPLDIEWPGFARFPQSVGITILFGFISGALWIAWNLVKLHVLQ
jgi:hypothetical protein